MPMYSACGNAALPALGFPIRESTDHRLFSAYPWLIAAVHALHRLLVPRHPPCALLILTVITHPANRTRGDTRYIGKTVQFSRTAQRGHPRDSRSVSQNSTACEPPHPRYPPTKSAWCADARLRPAPVDMARTFELHGRRYAGTCAR